MSLRLFCLKGIGNYPVTQKKKKKKKKLASLMLDGIAYLCSIHERSLAALLIDLVALQLARPKAGLHDMLAL